MNSKHIKSLILNYEMNDELLEENIKYNFHNTTKGIYNTLFELLKNYKKNKVLIN